MLKGLLLVLCLALATAEAEDWPDPAWQNDPATFDWQAVDAYAFPLALPPTAAASAPTRC